MELRLILMLLGTNQLGSLGVSAENILITLKVLMPGVTNLTGMTGDELLTELYRLDNADIALATVVQTAKPMTKDDIDLLKSLSVTTKSRIMTAMAIFMTVIMSIIDLGYAAMLYYVSIETKLYPDLWQVGIVLAGPGLIVWTYFGVLNKDRKTQLRRIVENSPQGGIIKRVLGDNND